MRTELRPSQQLDGNEPARDRIQSLIHLKTNNLPKIPKTQQFTIISAKFTFSLKGEIPGKGASRIIAHHVGTIATNIRKSWSTGHG